MTGEERIKQAAEQFADREHGAMRNVSVFNLLQYAFKCGAEWASDNYLKQIWHLATDEPKGKHWEIIYASNHGFFFTDEVFVEEFALGWRNYVQCLGVICWAYIKDLHPSK